MNLSVAATNTSALVTWSPPLDANGVISSYLVTLTSEALNTTLTESVGAGDLEAMFSELRPFVNYTVQVQPFTDSDGIPGRRAGEQFTTDAGSKSSISYSEGDISFWGQY